MSYKTVKLFANLKRYLIKIILKINKINCFSASTCCITRSKCINCFRLNKTISNQYQKYLTNLYYIQTTIKVYFLICLNLNHLFKPL